ncbi:solute carrier organic anion transporter family member 4A1-like [Branchiostoma floridae]|uniref:Solute carrier organic anion transporter family member 4A1-like n=1 Tax=Branchiostoma floridae TaxID=7739 RepID=A0A9J7LF48_BRAFL|nr:solute carrier organic anion transporter family member 4A1-like [Branchiostoma floridae]
MVSPDISQNNQSNYKTFACPWTSHRTPLMAKFKKMNVAPRTRFGWGRFTPGFLQVFNSPRWLLVFMCIGAALAAAITYGFVPIILSTLETLFSLSSKQSAGLAITYDIFGVMFIPFITYYGGMRAANKVRWNMPPSTFGSG